MSEIFRIKTTSNFERSYKRLIKGNSELVLSISNVVKKIREDQFQQGLRTHKVMSRYHSLVFSSKVTGDIRILWIQEGQSLIIILLKIGGHSGKGKVYK